MTPAPSPRVAILAESADAESILAHTRDTLTTFGAAFSVTTIDGRDDLAGRIAKLDADGAAVYIVANTCAAPLSAAVAELTLKPVLAIPLDGPAREPLDALQSSASPGPPVGTLAIGKAGAINAALLAVAILSNGDAALRERLRKFRDEQTAKVLTDRL